MAELLRTAPLDGFADTFAAPPGAVSITAEPFVAMVDVRVDDPRRPGLELPAQPNTWRAAGAGRAVWLGPDEWLVTDGTVAPEELAERLRGVVGPAGAVVDVSAQRTTLRLGGPHARNVLEKGCAIDLHPRSFPAGSAAQTTVGRAGVVLLALDGGEFALLVRSSFAGYLAEWLLDAALEFTA